MSMPIVSTLMELQYSNDPLKTWQMLPLWSRITHPKPTGPELPLGAPSKLSFKVAWGGSHQQRIRGIWGWDDKHEIVVAQSLIKSANNMSLNSREAFNQSPHSLITASITSSQLLALPRNILLFLSRHIPIKWHAINCPQILWILKKPQSFSMRKPLIAIRQPFCGSYSHLMNFSFNFNVIGQSYNTLREPLHFIQPYSNSMGKSFPKVSLGHKS